MDDMHRYTDETEALSRAIVAYARNRIASPQPLDGSATGEELTRRAGETVIPDGIGGEEALRIWAEVLAPATISTDHPSSIAFVPARPDEGVRAVRPRRRCLVDDRRRMDRRRRRDLGGEPGAAVARRPRRVPPAAGGVFVCGGSAGNLSALVAARARADPAARRSPGRRVEARRRRQRPLLGRDRRPRDGRRHRRRGGRRTRAAHRRGARVHARRHDRRRGRERVRGRRERRGDERRHGRRPRGGRATSAEARSLWFHVDGAYGGAGLAAPSVRDRYRGIERADSFIVDPHKWLFAPYDCCALVYRDPSAAHGVFRQEAGYLDTVNQPEASWSEWNPADYAYHLSRRARGLPLWFSLATYGTDAYRDAIERVLALTRETAAEIEARDDLELVMEPELSVVLFRRRRMGRPTTTRRGGGVCSPRRSRSCSPRPGKARSSPASASSTRAPRSTTCAPCWARCRASGRSDPGAGAPPPPARGAGRHAPRWAGGSRRGR